MNPTLATLVCVLWSMEISFQLSVGVQLVTPELVAKTVISEHFVVFYIFVLNVTVFYHTNILFSEAMLGWVVFLFGC